MKHGGMSPTKQHSQVAELVDAVNNYGYRGSGCEHYPYRFKSCPDTNN